MKALSLWQPWASAMAVGEKKIETRHWSTGYRGLIALHAAKRKPSVSEIAELLESGFWHDTFLKAGAKQLQCRRIIDALPYGCYVAVGDLKYIQRTENMGCEDVTLKESFFGNYSEGRFGWVFENVRALKVPVPAIGRQQLWTPTPGERAAIGNALMMDRAANANIEKAREVLSSAPDVPADPGDEL